MKKKFNCKVDGNSADRVTIDNEVSGSDLFFVEVVNHDDVTEKPYEACVAITKEEALELAYAIIESLK